MIRALTRRIVSHLGPGLKSGIVALTPAQLVRWYVTASTDAFLVSYPKTGRTWFRLMIGRALELHYDLPEGNTLNLAELSKLAHRMPRVEVTHDGDPHLKRPEELDTPKHSYRRSKVVFLVRDPRDVIVSLFFQQKKRTDGFAGDLGEFVQQDRGGFESIIQYYNVWIRNRDVPRKFLIVRYEDLHADAQGQLRSTLEFIGVNGVSEATIKRAVDYASFDRMRKMELDDHFGSDKLRPGDRSDHESFKTRKGRVGGHVDDLPPEQIRELDLRIARDLNPEFGYGGPVGP